MKKLIILIVISLTIIASCKKEKKAASRTTNNTTTTTPPTNTPTTTPARLRFILKLDSTQVSLDNIGNPYTMPGTHKAQSPRFNKFGAHYIELASYDTTGVGRGTVLYVGSTVNTTPVTVTSGTNSATFTNAIDFTQLSLVPDGGELFSVPLSQVKPATYKWFRMSIAYQNYDVYYKINQGTSVNSYTLQSDYDGSGTIASFVGYQTYINSYLLKTQTVTVNAPKLQGYWAFETNFVLNGVTYTNTPSQGQAPPGATTVVNPLFATSPIPAGSCLVTGKFVNTSQSPQTLTITGNETQDIVVVVSVSTNKSFEWIEHSGDNTYNPLNNDTVTNMGLRGIIPIIQP